jgi:anti-anti-sigma factor
MAIKIRFEHEANRIAISGDLNIYHIEEIQQKLTAHPGAELDLGKVDELDGAGLQVLLAYCRDSGLRLAQVSEAVGETLALVGMNELLGAGS